MDEKEEDGASRADPRMGLIQNYTLKAFKVSKNSREAECVVII